MVRHLQEERQRLLAAVGQLEESNGGLTQQVDALQAELQAAATRSAGSDAGTSRQRDRERETLQQELNDAKRELDLKTVEADGLAADLKAAKQRADALREMQAKLEVELGQMSDELDVARDKGVRLAKAEAQLEKYQQRLEEMVGLKKQNKELSEKMDQYLDQIHELESNSRGSDTLNKLLDEYKVKNVRLEKERFEALSEAQVRAHEVERMGADLAAAVEARRRCEDELQAARTELAATAAAAEGSRAGSGTLGADDDSGGAFEVETVASLREKLRKTERELKAAQAGGGTRAAPAPSSSSSSSAGASSEELALLRAELDDARRLKQEREEALLAAKKQLMDAQSEVHRVTRAHQELEKQAAAGADAKAAAATLKEHESRLAQMAHTAKLLEAKLEEKEGTINRLEQEKGKLESYAKRTLIAFKDKYMAALQGMKQEKKDLEDRLVALTARAEQNQETARREERLVLSAVYDLGLRIMDKKIADQVGGGRSGDLMLVAGQKGGLTVLGAQRSRLDDAGLGLSPIPNRHPAAAAAAGGGAGGGLTTPSK
jgi:protein HOOK3